MSATLEQLAILGDNWDGYGAQPPTSQAIAAVRRFLSYGHFAIVPLNDGGIQLEWHAGDIDLEIEFDAAGKPALVYAVRASDDHNLAV